jgi:CRP-like cAMP-binding protein
MFDGDQRQLTFLDQIPRQARAVLVAAGRPVRFAMRQVLLGQGDAATHVYLLRSGMVKVVRVEPDGRSALLAIRSAGDLIGETSALDGRERSATVTALAPVVANRYGAEEFHRLMVDTGLTTALMKYVTGRLRESDQLRAELAVLPVRTRLARTLLRLADTCGSVHGAEVRLDVSQEDLAQAVGASRNMVVKELGALRREGLVRTGRRRVVLPDLYRVHRVATEVDPPE